VLCDASSIEDIGVVGDTPRLEDVLLDGELIGVPQWLPV